MDSAPAPSSTTPAPAPNAPARTISPPLARAPSPGHATTPPRDLPTGVDPGPLARAFYTFGVHVCEIVLTIFFRFRRYGRARVPCTGPLVVVMNHQSYLDPAVCGPAVRPRPLTFLARHTLFFPVFGTLIRALNAIPLNQEGSDGAAIRTALEALKRGRAVLVFPEGSRTPTGAMHLFNRGAWLLMTRARCPILPVAIEGAYDAFPRGTSLPRLFRPISASVGEPIKPEVLRAMDPDAGLRFLRDRVEALRLDLHARMTRAGARLSTRPAAETLTD